MKRYLAFALVLLTVAGIGLVGCKKEGGGTAGGGGQGAQAGGGGGGGTGGEKVKIGFLVKQPDEPWFQTEWTFAQKCADEHGFELIKIGVPDGEKALAAIDNLAANGAKGFVICTPDVRLGPAIVAKAKQNNMKVMTVDDQFVGPDGKIMQDVPHIGVAAREVGHLSGQALYDQFKKHGWPVDQTGACIVTFNELDTARERTEGIMEKLVQDGFPKERIFTAPQKTTDIPGSFDAANILITQHPEVKYWLAAGMNDTASLGAVRALEGRGFTPDNSVAIGINGTEAIDEFKKPNPTPFYGSILMEANVHGYDSALAMYNWVTTGKEPDPKQRFTGGLLITRENFEQELKKHGMWR